MIDFYSKINSMRIELATNYTPILAHPKFMPSRHDLLPQIGGGYFHAIPPFANDRDNGLAYSCRNLIFLPLKNGRKTAVP